MFFFYTGKVLAPRLYCLVNWYVYTHIFTAITKAQHCRLGNYDQLGLIIHKLKKNQIQKLISVQHLPTHVAVRYLG